MRKIINISINTIRGFAIPVMNFFVLIIGIRHFGKALWGTLIAIIIWTTLMTFVLNWGNKDFLIRKYSKEPSKLFYVFYSNFFSRSLLFPICLVFFFFFSFQIALFAILLVFLIHCYQSFESLIVFQQKFSSQLVSETLGFLILLAGIYYCNSFNLLVFLQLYCVSYLAKNMYLFLSFKMWKEKMNHKISIQQYKNSLPFFILGLSGMINSKADLYIVNSFLPSEKIADYQLLISAFLMLQSLSVFIIAPLNKQLYRTNNETISKVKTLFRKFAIPIVVLSSCSIWVILEKYVYLGLDWKIYILCTLASFPSFFYVIPILNLYKKNLEKKVLYANLIAAFFNIIITLLLLPEYGILGAIISVFISQWLFLIIIKRYENTTS